MVDWIVWSFSFHLVIEFWLPSFLSDIIVSFFDNVLNMIAIEFGFHSFIIIYWHHYFPRASVFFFRVVEFSKEFVFKDLYCCWTLTWSELQTLFDQIKCFWWCSWYFLFERFSWISIDKFIKDWKCKWTIYFS